MVPLHTVLPGFAEIEIVGVTAGFTVIVIAFESAEVGLAQFALLFSTQVTIRPFVRVVVVNVGLFVPTFTPFTLHW